MEKTNNQVFLAKIFEKIKNGDYDKYLTLPFMSKELLYSTIKARIFKKITSGGTPILNDAEIKDCISEAKETAVSTFALFIKEGLITRTDTGYAVSEKGELAVKCTHKIIK